MWHHTAFCAERFVSLRSEESSVTGGVIVFLIIVCFIRDFSTYLRVYVRFEENLL